jgi:phosphoadenosine phosphosulfate reductase
MTMTTEEILTLAVERHHPRLVLMCSFQKESSVLVDALLRVAPDARIATIDTGVLFPETLETWRAFEEHFDIEIEVHDASGPWSPDVCCSDRKVSALERALADSEAWVSGIRREQAATRADAKAVEFDKRRGVWKYNPLVNWTEDDLWQRIRERELPYHPLHDRGYDSIGCAPCTSPGAGRSGRWVGSDKIECGLHA